MANVHIGDDVLRNILARLPGKPLLRLRCVSKHWNGLISDPYFMKLRSHRMILLPFPRPLVVIDDNVPVEDKAHSMVRIRSSLELNHKDTRVSIIGTLNGVVLLALHHSYLRCHLILYNPLTCASKMLAVMDPPPSRNHPYVFGFGYDATTDDLKIVRFEALENQHCVPLYKCDAFDLKTSSWSMLPQYFLRYFKFGGDAGIFLNGFLYWSIYYPHFGILAVNVKEMDLRTVDIPNALQCTPLVLGSLDGCLCMINNKIHSFTFDVWLMKEDGVWSKARSFRFGLEGNVFYPICILGDGRILIKSSATKLVIYDTSKEDSYKAFDGLATPGNFAKIDESLSVYMMHREYPITYSRSMEYVESLVSPFDMCFPY